MKPLRPAVVAVILTALLAVPAHAGHKRFGGFFVEPYFVPLPERPFRGRLRRQDGYPVALVRQRLRGIGFYGIGKFDVYPSAYGVTATDPGGVRVRMVIDRWSGDIVRAREIEDVPVARSYKPPASVDRAPPNTPATRRKISSLHAPPLPRPAPERLTQTALVEPSPGDLLEREEMPPPAVESEDIVTSSVHRPDEVPETGPIGESTAVPPSLAGAEAAPPPGERELPVAEAVPFPPDVAAKPARPVTALQGERFDPADGRGQIADY